MKTLRLIAEIKESAKMLFSAVISLISPLITAVAFLLKYSWKLTKLLLMVGVVAIVVSLFIERERYGKISSRYHIYKYNMINRYRVKDVWRNKWVGGWHTYIDTEFGADSLILFSKKNLFGENELYGYLDARTAKVAIEPQFHFAGKFSEGLAAVRQADKFGFINTKGEMVIEVDKWVRSRGTNIAMKGGCAILNTGGDNGYGILSHEGEWLLLPEHCEITKCEEGRFIVQTGDDYDYGVWSQNEGWILEPKYDRIEESCYDKAFVVTEDGMRRKCDYNGKTTIPLAFDSAEILSHSVAGRPDVERIASGYAIFHIDQMAGLLEVSTGKVLIPAIYDDIEMLSKGVFMVTIGDNKHLVDRNGNVINDK